MKNAFSAVVKSKLNNKDVNATLDTGAGPSVIDFGTLEHLGLSEAVRKRDGGLVNASGDPMEVMGVVDIIVTIQNMRPIMHEFAVINTKSYRNVLLGRDFMKRFKKVTFDFAKNKVKLGAV